MTQKFTSKSKVVKHSGMFFCTFYCDLCHHGYSAEAVTAENPAEAVDIAGKEARQHFNLCHQCKKWVCDMHYNEDVMLCVECEPKEK